MKVIAHRGANREALENSWDAYEKAIDGGAERIELDVHLTADGHVAINHDDSLATSAGLQVRLSQEKRAALARLKLKNGEPLPFLDEVLVRLLPRVELNIEIKGASLKLAEAVAKLLNATDAPAERVVISSFCADPLAYLSEVHPRFARACLWPNDYLSWPNLSLHAPQVLMSRCRARIIHPYIKAVDDNLMDQARARNWLVYAWAGMADEESDREGLWATLKTLGIDGLCTNYPRQLAQWNKEAHLDETRFERR